MPKQYRVLTGFNYGDDDIRCDVGQLVELPPQVARDLAGQGVVEEAAEEVDLAALHVPELRERARLADVEGYSKLSKAELIEALIQAELEGPADV